jgi:hypothetical protein
MKSGIEAIATKDWGGVSLIAFPMHPAENTYIYGIRQDFNLVVNPSDVRDFCSNAVQRIYIMRCSL